MNASDLTRAFDPQAFGQADLARWWCDFNRNEWPEDFPCVRLYGNAREVLWAYMWKIEAQIGRKRCLLHWNVERGMRPGEFEEWWQRRGKMLVRLAGFHSGGTTL